MCTRKGGVDRPSMSLPCDSPAGLCDTFLHKRCLYNFYKDCLCRLFLCEDLWRYALLRLRVRDLAEIRRKPPQNRQKSKNLGYYATLTKNYHASYYGYSDPTIMRMFIPLITSLECKYKMGNNNKYIFIYLQNLSTETNSQMLLHCVHINDHQYRAFTALFLFSHSTCSSQ